MYTVTRQGVEEHGERGYQRLTFTRSHLGNLTLMEHGTTEELHVVVYHLPLQVVTSGSPVVVIDGLVAVDSNKVLLRVTSQFAVEVGGGNYGLLVLGEATGGLLDDGEHLEHHLVEGLLIDLKGFLL